MRKISTLLFCFLFFSGGKFFAQNAFIEKDGIIIMEIESHPLIDTWAEETKIEGFSGESYYRWNGSNFYTGPPGFGEMEFTFKINRSGKYKVYMHNRRDHDEFDKANDIWFKMNDHSYEKMFADIESWNKWGYIMHIEGGSNNFSLDTGLHKLYIQPRSSDFIIDRIIIVHEDAILKYNSALLPESPREGMPPALYIDEIKVNPQVFTRNKPSHVEIFTRMHLEGPGNEIDRVQLLAYGDGDNELFFTTAGWNKFFFSDTIEGIDTIGNIYLPVRITDDSGLNYHDSVLIQVVDPLKDSLLKSLSFSEGAMLSFPFSPLKNEYDLLLLNGNDILQVTPVAHANQYHSIMINGATVMSGQSSDNIDVTTSSRVIEIEVVAPDGVAKNTYTLNISIIEKPIVKGMTEDFSSGYGTAHWGWDAENEQNLTRQTLSHEIDKEQLSISVNRDASVNGSLGFEGLEYDFYHQHILDFSESPLMMFDIMTTNDVDVEIALLDTANNYQDTQITMNVPGDSLWHTLTYDWTGYLSVDKSAIRQFLFNFNPGWERSFFGDIRIDNIAIGTEVSTVDVSALRDLVAISAIYADTLSNPENKIIYKKVLEKANAVLNDPDALQYQVDQMYSELYWIQLDFTGSSVLEVVDFSKLQELTDTSQIMLDNAVVGDGEGEYPPHRASALEYYILLANEVLSNRFATQNEVDFAYDELLAAKNNFIPNAITIFAATKKAQGFKIFPNPANVKLTLTSDKTLESLAFYTLGGRKMKVIKYPASALTIDVSAWEKGWYIVEVIYIPYLKENYLFLKK